MSIADKQDKNRIRKTLEREVLLDTTILELMEMSPPEVIDYLAQKDVKFKEELKSHIIRFGERHIQHIGYLAAFQQAYLTD